MTTATATVAPATHEEWIAVMNDSISEFAQDQIHDDILASAAAGDYHARLYVAHEVQEIVRLEALTDTELAARLAESHATHRAMIELDDYSEYDVNDYESYYAYTWRIEELQTFRAARARYIGLAPLVHSPFAALAVSA